MKRKFLLIFALLVFMLGMIIGILNFTNIVGMVIGEIDDSRQGEPEHPKFDYVWTTAVCDGNNCRDFEIACDNGVPIRMDPVSGMVIFPDDWQDNRIDRELCPR